MIRQVRQDCSVQYLIMPSIPADLPVRSGSTGRDAETLRVAAGIPLGQTSSVQKSRATVPDRGASSATLPLPRSIHKQRYLSHGVIVQLATRSADMCLSHSAKRSQTSLRRSLACSHALAYVRRVQATVHHGVRRPDGRQRTRASLPPLNRLAYPTVSKPRGCVDQ